MKTLTAIILTLTMGACAPYSANIKPLSPEQSYNTVPCHNLEYMKSDSGHKLDMKILEQDKIAGIDTTITIMSILFFVPGIIGVSFTGNKKDEVATLKGEHEAITNEYTERCL